MGDDMGVRLPCRESIDHTPGRSQQWSDVDEDIEEWTDRIVERLVQLDDVAGVYLHGSLAMGGFYRPKSDLDLLVVTDSIIPGGTRSSLASDMLSLFDQRPIVGGIVESPFYGVLNICRCALVLNDDPGAPPSKEEGAPWAPSTTYQTSTDA